MGWIFDKNGFVDPSGGGVVVTVSANVLANRFLSPANNYPSPLSYAYAVTTENVSVGNSTVVIATGIGEVELEGDVYAGNVLEVGTDGKAKVKDQGVIVARALEDGVAGNIIKIKI